jgi:hypothetical protein
MWFMNRIWNPIVRFILRSSLHGIMSKSIMLITYVGQKSGKEFTLPVSYLEDGATIYVIPGMPEMKVWWHNIHIDTPVKLTLRGKVISAHASLLTPEKDLDSMTHALDLFFRKMPAGAGMYNVSREKDGSFVLEDLKRAAGSTVMIRIKTV